MSIAEAAVGLVLVDETASVLSDHQVLVMTLYALLEVTQLFITLSQISERSTLVQQGTSSHHLVKSETINYKVDTQAYAFHLQIYLHRLVTAV